MYARALLGPIRWGVCLVCSASPYSEGSFFSLFFFAVVVVFVLFCSLYLLAVFLLFVITSWRFYGIVDSRCGSRGGCFCFCFLVLVSRYVCFAFLLFLDALSVSCHVPSSRRAYFSLFCCALVVGVLPSQFSSVWSAHGYLSLRPGYISRFGSFRCVYGSLFRGYSCSCFVCSVFEFLAIVLLVDHGRWFVLGRIAAGLLVCYFR